jgi:hypothetical protein
MIKPNNFYKETEKRYKKRGLNYEQEKLFKLTDTLYQQAKQNYLKLDKPKFCDLENYISVWINEEIGNDIAKKSISELNLNNPPDDFKATIDFYKNYPPSYFEKSKETHIRNQINFNDIKEKWLLMVKERNNFSLNKGYKSRIDMILKDFKIPKSEYNKFLKNTDKIIHFCKVKVYLESSTIFNQKSSNFCFICNLKSFPFKELTDFLDFFRKKEYFFRKNENRVEIQFENSSKTKYIKETDSFNITLNKEVNTKHQIVDLIHELAHVTSTIKILKQNKFIKIKAYYLEKSAIKKEIIFLKKYFRDILIAKLGDILRIICQTLFEIEIYQNPNKNPDKLYLKYLNKCFKKNKMTNSCDYLSNQDILYKSFSQLIYAIAYVNVLTSSSIK